MFTDTQGVCVLTGLLGTLLMPLLESHIGLVRAGLWSISFELCCLLPAMLAFFIGTGVYGEHGPVGNQVLLFGGIAMSRVGLWSFDLCQVGWNPYTCTCILWGCQELIFSCIAWCAEC
jgi:iron-regulated transporter 1